MRGYALGGKVIEAVTGEAIPQCYQRHLLGPLDVARFGQLLLNKGAHGKQRFFREETRPVKPR